MSSTTHNGHADQPAIGLADADRLLIDGKPHAALAAYQLLAKDRDDPLLWQRQGAALLMLRRPMEAFELLSRAVERAPQLHNARHHLAVALTLLRRHVEATALFDALLSELAAENDAVLRHHASRAFRDLGDLDKARALCREAVGLAPANPKFRFSCGIIALMQGDWAAGWEDYACRWRGWDREAVERPPETSLPQWQGEAVSHKAGLVVHAEQGFGDCLQFCRYVLGTIDIFPKVRFVVPGALRNLITRSMAPGIEVCDKSQHGAASDDAFTHHAMLMDLPRLLNRPTPEQAPGGGTPYLKADSGLVSEWNRKLPGLAPRIGFVWAGGHQTAVTGRDMPLDSLKPLLILPNLHFISLQRDLRLTGGTVLDPLVNARSFDDTAAIIANLDLVISVDTAVAHLAAGLGRPVWLLNRYESEWRWGRGRQRTGWYQCMRIFTQPRPGDWDAVVDAVVEAMKASMGSPERFR
ncbi:hypothetical protein IP70_21525 [alpha proteobacterium AAP38]|nr:hypothetical protein IP70_21525 [alpha proteobacterium AAP38]